MSNYPPGVSDNDFDLPSVSEPDPAHQLVYLGDAVYVHYDYAGRLELLTSNGMDYDNRIVLDPEVITALLDYIKRTPA